MFGIVISVKQFKSYEYQSRSTGKPNGKNDQELRILIPFHGKARGRQWSIATNINPVPRESWRERMIKCYEYQSRSTGKLKGANDRQLRISIPFHGKAQGRQWSIATNINPVPRENIVAINKNIRENLCWIREIRGTIILSVFRVADGNRDDYHSSH